MTAESPTYHDRPVLKEPVWIWSVPVYFYVGGLSGAAGTLGAVAQVLGDEDLDDLVEGCRRLAAAGSVIGSVLLVIDLGRPERFLNMLRVFRPTSALNMGSWILAAHSGASVTATILGHTKRGEPLGNLAGVAAGASGLPMSGYTGVLLGDTAVPLWHATRRSLPILFVASAAASASSALEVTTLSAREHRIVRRFGIAAKLMELVAMKLVERDAGEVERVGRPLGEGVSGSLWKVARTSTVAGLGLSLVPARGRFPRFLSGVLGSVASLALRTALFQAGKVSSRDPRATFEQQRERVG